MKSSPYYPPRAGIYSRCMGQLQRTGFRIRALLPNFIPAFRSHVDPFTTFVWLLLPGLMWRTLRPGPLGNRILFTWAALLTIQIASMNPNLANAAAILTSILHAFSIASVFVVAFPHWVGMTGVLKSLIYTLLLLLGIYGILLRSVTSQIAQRVSFQGHSVMTYSTEQAFQSPPARGEWVTYHFQNLPMTFDRILALPGDTVRFHEHTFEVNGQHYERLLPTMPPSGELQIPPGHYFIWPTGAKTNILIRTDMDLFYTVAIIDWKKIRGRVYHRWLWSTPDLPPLKPVAPVETQIPSK